MSKFTNVNIAIHSLVRWIVSDNILFCILYTVLHWTEDCTCSRRLPDCTPVEFFKISNSRTELRCGRCHGLMGWYDESPRTKKIMPFKRAWSEEECLAMR
jgi:hypothetical protein